MSDDPTKVPVDVVQRLRQRYAKPENVVLMPSAAPCRELDAAAGEALCEGARHLAAESLDTPTGPTVQRTVLRRCPAVVRAERSRAARERVQPELVRLRSMLEQRGLRADFDRDPRPVSEILRAALDPRRPVTGLQELLQLVDHYRTRRPDRNLLLTAEDARDAAQEQNKGTGKTHAQLVLHFAWLELGVNSVFVTSSQLRSLAKRRLSGTGDEMSAAERDFERLKRADVVVWSDVGDSKESSRGMETTVQDLAEEGPCLVLSMNHSRRTLALCPDVGERAVDRFWGDYRGNAALEIELSGPSQRTHSLRAPLRAEGAGR